MNDKNTNFNDRVNKTLQEEKISFDVTVDKPNILHKLGLKTRKRTFVVAPPPLRALARISYHIKEIGLTEKQFYEMKENSTVFDMLRKTLPIVGENYEHIVNAIAVAITHREPSKKLVNFLGGNMKPKELYEITTLLIQRFDLTFFLLSMACLKGINIWEEDGTHSKSSGEQSEQGTKEKMSSTESRG